MTKIAVIVLVCLCAVAVRCQAAEEVLMLTEVTRHGARAAFHLGDSEVDWMKDLQSSELSPVGYRQHYLLGKEMAKRYPDLFSRRLHAEEYYARSSQFQRTSTSAIAHLMGLWDHFDSKELDFENGNSRIEPPEVDYDTKMDTFKTPLPNGLVVAPIHTETTDEDDTLYFVSSLMCPRASEESLKFREQMGIDLAKKPAQIELIKDAAKLLSVDYDKYKNKFELCYEIGDFVAMDNKHTDTPKIGPNHPAYKLLMRCYETNIVGKYSKPEILQVVSAILIDDILSKMEAKRVNKTSFKYYLYTAHDTTLAPLLTLTGVMNPECFIKDVLDNTYSDCKNYPDTAANIVFELLKVNGEYHARMLSNFEEVDVCGLKNKEDRFRCPIEQFKAKWRSMINPDWQVYCNTPSRIRDYFRYQGTPWQLAGLALVVSNLVLALVFGITIIYLIRKQQNLKSIIKVNDAILDGEKSFDA